MTERRLSLTRLTAIALKLATTAVLLSACASSSYVALEGKFSTEVPAPREVRVLLDPHYGHGHCEHEKGEIAHALAMQPNPYVSIVPDAKGIFRTPLFEVERDRMSPFNASPSFFLAFDNERDVLYAVGEVANAFSYRVYDAITKEQLHREDVCWRIVRGGYLADRRKTLKALIAIAPNFDSRKICLPPGEFTPNAVERRSSMPQD